METWDGRVQLELLYDFCSNDHRWYITNDGHYNLLMFRGREKVQDQWKMFKERNLLIPSFAYEQYRQSGFSQPSLRH